MVIFRVFHSILAKKLNLYHFSTLQKLEQGLVLFFEKYNNERLHSSARILVIPPFLVDEQNFNKNEMVGVELFLQTLV